MGSTPNNEGPESRRDFQPDRFTFRYLGWIDVESEWPGKTLSLKEKVTTRTNDNKMADEDNAPFESQVSIPVSDGHSFACSSGNLSLEQNDGLGETGNDADMVRSTTSGRDDDADFLDHRSFAEKFKNIAFSVLFYMAHGNEFPDVLDYISMITEDLQMFAFFLSNEIGELYKLPDGLPQIVNVDFGVMSITQFQLIMYLSVGAVFAMLLNVAVVAKGFIAGQQKYIWPIRTLRFMATLLPTVAFNPIYEALSSVLTCNLIMPVGTPAIAAVTGVYFQTDPTRKGPSHKIHGRVDVLYLLIKTGLISLYKFLALEYYIIKIVAAVFSCLAMYLLMLYYMPYFNLRINQLRSAIYLSAAAVGLVALCSSIAFSSTGVVRGWETVGVMSPFILLGFAVGWWHCGYVYRRIIETTERNLEVWEQTAADENQENEKLVFWCWPHVEIAARKLTEHMDDRHRNFNKAKSRDLKRLFSRGLQEFPEEPNIRMSYAFYLHYLRISDADALRQVAKTKALEPPLDIEFRIYYVHQISNQSHEADFLGLGTKLDVASYAEFQKLDRTAKINHYLAIQEIRSMWKLVTDKGFKLEDLAKVASRLYKHAEDAQNAYMLLAAKFPKSKVILRYYARFCYDVTNDVVRGENLTTHADELENEGITIEDDAPAPIFEPPVPRRSASIRVATDLNNAESPLPRRSASIRAPMDSASNNSGHRQSVSGSVSRKPSKRGTGAFDQMSAGKSDTSSAHSTQRREAAAAQRLREARIEKRAFFVRVMFLAKTLLIIAFAIANFVVVSDLLYSSRESLEKMGWYTDRCYYTAMTFRRIRQLESAKDIVQFKAIQNVLMQEMDRFSTSAENLFMTRDEKDEAANALEVAQNTPTLFSNYPLQNTTRFFNLSLFYFVQGYITSGFQIANVTMDLMKESKYNNQVRFILDNYLAAQVPYNVAIQQHFLPKEWRRQQNSRSIVFTLTGLIIGVVSAFIVAVDFMFLRFNRTQVKTLEIFRAIPKEVIVQSLEDLEESDSADIFQQNIIKSAESAGGKTNNTSNYHINFRSMLYFTALAMATLTGVFAYINLDAFGKIGENFTIIGLASELREDAVRGYNAALDLHKFDALTWGNRTRLIMAYGKTTSDLIRHLQEVMFGSPTRLPPGRSYNNFPRSAVALLNEPSCLALNASLCNPANRAWNDTIGYNSNSVSLGLLHLTTQVARAHLDLSSAAAVGAFPDEGRVKFLDSILEPDFLDGWEQMKMRVMKDTTDLVNDRSKVDMAIFIMQIVLAVGGFIGQVVLVSKIMSNYRFTDHCIYGILNRLPAHAKKIPEIEKALKDGGIYEEVAAIKRAAIIMSENEKPANVKEAPPKQGSFFSSNTKEALSKQGSFFSRVLKTGLMENAEPVTGSKSGDLQAPSDNSDDLLAVRARPKKSVTIQSLRTSILSQISGFSLQERSGENVAAQDEAAPKVPEPIEQSQSFELGALEVVGPSEHLTSIEAVPEDVGETDFVNPFSPVTDVAVGEVPIVYVPVHESREYVSNNDETRQ
ncbi:hypothetical protein HDV05_007389 [Chytridiales sp. JEL 0842]|nr:hypothetical protein HDV05_007389 [Chytridiales sp. JEL 0842]